MQKNQAFPSLYSGHIVNLIILQSDWLRAFCPISQEPEFSQVWDQCKNTTNKLNFLYRPNSEKLITEFLNKSNKTYFWPVFQHIFPIFGTIFFFFLQIPLSHAQQNMGRDISRGALLLVNRYGIPNSYTKLIKN